MKIIVGVAITFVVSLCCCAHSDERDSSKVAERIRQIMAKQNVDWLYKGTDDYDPRAFDPEVVDPLILEATWEQVRMPILKALADELKTDVHSDELGLHLLEIAKASSTSKDGKVNVSTTVRVVIDATGAARTALSQVFPEECLPLTKKTEKTILIAARELAVPWEELPTATSEFVASSKQLRDLGFASTRPTIRKDKVQVVTSWKSAGRQAGYELHWRVFVQVKRSEDERYLSVSVRGQVGRTLPGAAITTIEYLGTEEDDSRFDAVIPDRITQKAVRSSFTEDKSLLEPRRVSSRGQLMDALLEDYVARITKEK